MARRSSAAVVTIPTPERPPVPGVFRAGMKPAYLIAATRQHAACATPGCGEAIYSDGGAWRHARNDSYQCPSLAGWADVYDVLDVERQLTELEERLNDEAQASAEQAEEVGHDAGFEDGKEEGLDEGKEAGRREMHAEIDDALSAAFDRVVIGPGATAADAERMLREALADAWNSIAL